MENNGTVTLSEDVTMDVEINKLASLDLAAFTVNGNVSITSEEYGNTNITSGKIEGNLEINTPNATVINSSDVTGQTIIKSVDTNSFTSTGKHTGGILMKGKGRLKLSENSSATDVTINTEEGIEEEVILEGAIKNIVLKITKNIIIKTEEGTTTTIQVEEGAVVEGLKIDVPVTIISSEPVKATIKENVKVKIKSEQEDDERTFIGSGEEEEIILILETIDLKLAKESASNKKEEDYTIETWTNLKEALKLKENSQEDVDKKVQAINDAIQNLEFAGKAELDAIKADVEGLSEDNYTAESWEVLQNALNLPENTNEEIMDKIAAMARAKENLAEKDKEAPVIKLKGNSEIILTVGETFNDPGVTAIDNVDGDISNIVVIVGEVDTGTVGTYTITYNVSDMAGNNAVEVTRTVIINPEPFRQTSLKIDGNKVTLGFNNKVLVNNKSLENLDISTAQAKKEFLGGLFDLEEINEKLNYDNIGIEVTSNSITITANDILNAESFRDLDAKRYGELFIELKLIKENIIDEYGQKVEDNEGFFIKLTSFIKRGLYGELIDYKEGEKKAIFLNREQGIGERDKKREVTLEVNTGATATKATVKMSTNYAIGTDIGTWSGNKGTDWFTKDGAILFARLYRVDNGKETPIFFNTVFKSVKIAPGPFGGLTYQEGTGRLHGDFGTGINGTKLFAGETRIADSKYKGALSYNTKLDGANIYSIWLPKGSINVNITNVLKDNVPLGKYIMYLEAYAPLYKDVEANEKWGSQEDLPILDRAKIVEFTIE